MLKDDFIDRQIAQLCLNQLHIPPVPIYESINRCFKSSSRTFTAHSSLTPINICASECIVNPVERRRFQQRYEAAPYTQNLTALLADFQTSRWKRCIRSRCRRYDLISDFCEIGRLIVAETFNDATGTLPGSIYATSRDFQYPP